MATYKEIIQISTEIGKIYEANCEYNDHGVYVKTEVINPLIAALPNGKEAIAAMVVANSWDGRISVQAKAWAEAQKPFKPDPDKRQWINVPFHMVILDHIACEFAKKQNKKLDTRLFCHILRGKRVR